MNLRKEFQFALYMLLATTLTTLACGFSALSRHSAKSFGASANPVIRFKKIPPRGGGSDRLETIAGIVTGVNVKECDCRIVIYAQTDSYYVQPYADAPFTELQDDNSFKTDIHLGFRYFALLVKKSYRPVATLSKMPSVGGDVLTIASVEAGAEAEKAVQAPGPTRTIRFSGREWKVKASNDQAVGPGPCHFSDSQENVWVDAADKLHLRLSQRDGIWRCAEVVLAEEHSYGTYLITLDTTPKSIAQALNAVLGAFVWNDADAAHNHDEIDFELSPWSQQGNKLAQWVIQPYSNPRNIVRFDVPETLAPTTHVFTWRPDRVECASFEGTGRKQHTLYHHTFTQGIPPNTKGTNARINLWLLGGKPPADNQELEIVFSRFDFKPLP